MNPRRLSTAVLVASSIIASASGAVAQPGPEGVAVAPVEEPPEPVADDDESGFVPEGHEEQMADRPLAPAELAFDPGKGVTFRSLDGDFAIAARLRAQFLYTLEHDHAAPSGEDATLHGFQIRRARLQFGGHVFGEHNKYKAEFAFSPRDMGMRDGTPQFTPILDWYVELDYLRDLTLRLGQYKVPFNRQRVISSGDLELVDRSLANGEFNLDRDIGLDLRSEDFLGLGLFRYYAGIYLAAGRDAHQLRALDMHYLARLEVLPLGGADESWDYHEADFARSLRPRLSLGGAYAFIDEAESDRGILGSAPLDGGTTDYHNVTADLVLHWVGLSLSSEVYWRRGTRHFGSATTIDDAGNEVPEPQVPARDGVGFYVQAGFLVPHIPLQIAGRYSLIEGLGETSLPDTAEIGGGLSWYFAEHPLKLQVDYFRERSDSFDPATATFVSQGWGAGVDRVRAQLQVAY